MGLSIHVETAPPVHTVPTFTRQDAILSSMPVSEDSRDSSTLSITTLSSESGSLFNPGIHAEIYCNEKDCTAVFSGIHRKGNLARHKRLKHKGYQVYFCEDSSCDRVFKRLDARLKHYRRWHPDLASPYHAHPQTRHANRDQYPDFFLVQFQDDSSVHNWTYWLYDISPSRGMLVTSLIDLTSETYPYV